MLVLSRTKGETILIGDNITVHVTKVMGNRVTIGIDAPKEIRILRGELNVSEDQSSSDTAVVSSGDVHSDVAGRTAEGS